MSDIANSRAVQFGQQYPSGSNNSSRRMDAPTHASDSSMRPVNETEQQAAAQAARTALSMSQGSVTHAGTSCFITFTYTDDLTNNYAGNDSQHARQLSESTFNQGGDTGTLAPLLTGVISLTIA